MAKIQNISFIGKPDLDQFQQELQPIINSLQSDYTLFFDTNFARQFSLPATPTEDLLQCDLLLIFGGDGTLLKSARKVKSSDPKILAINLGNLGFLTEIDIHEFAQTFNTFLQGNYELDKRKLLDISIIRKGDVIMESSAMNECVIHQGGKSRLINLNIEVSGQSLCSLKADGLIVSTSTGSTGHSLSAGGPIIHPHINAILINPICPISLSNRPIAVPSDRSIEIVVEKNREFAERVGLTIDGQETYQLEYNDKIYIKESSHHISLIRMLNSSYYQSLRDKLNWSK